jgi:hypothetical protein
MKLQSIRSALIFLPLALAAQSIVVPLNNWPVSSRVPRRQVQGAGRAATPKLQLPGGVTADVLVFVPMTPCRLADTRPVSGYPALGSTPLASLTPRTLPIAGSCGVIVQNGGGNPEAYSLGVTVVPPGGTTGGYLLVYPNPVTPVPLSASLTWNPAASYQSATVIAAASPDGSVNVVANLPTNVVIDINGYYAAPTDLESNTSLGSGAMGSATLNTSGSLNTAFGYQAMFSNTTGGYNTALGSSALSANISGFGNTALGADALENTTGGENIGIGHLAGSELTTGNGNIIIGNQGTPSDTGTIRIGSSQTSAFIAGIVGNNLTNPANVVIDSNGQLGVQLTLSSRRYKGEIQDMGDASRDLLRLRPVTFHYKKPNPDGSRPLEYGLIAEEVDAVYPELVVRGQDGQIETVQYSKLPAMLLNELQKQDEMIRKLAARVAALEAQLASTTVSAAQVLPAAVSGR